MSKKDAEAKKIVKKARPATQQYLDIAEIREDTVILKDGTMRAVLMVSSINFALKSDEEQQAIVQAYMQFLNALEFQVQIVIQSRKMNIDQYLKNLDSAERTTPNEALRTQILDYRFFVSQLVSLGEIMEKKFYIVIPYDPVSDKQRGFFRRLRDAVSSTSILTLKAKQFAERKVELDRRVGTISGLLSSMSLTSVQLDTQGLIELYYTAYNPDIFATQKLSDVPLLQVEDRV